MLTKENGFSFPWRFPISVDREISFALVTLLVTLLLVYSNSFQGEWHFDDFHTIVDNPYNRMKALTGDELVKTFYGPTYGERDQRITRPLAYASFALNYLFGGTDVLGYHVVNFIIHLSSAFFLFLLIRLTLRLPPMKERYGSVAYPVALLSAFIWATSPLHVHAVTIIVQRMASMAGLAYVASLYFYARARAAGQGREGRRQGDHVDALVLHGAEQLGKPQVVADGQPEAAEGGIDDADPVAGLDGFRFAVVLVRLDQVHVEQVDLVVAGNRPPLLVEHQTGGPDLVGSRDLDGHGTAHDPDAEAAGELGQKLLQRSGAVGLADADDVALREPHEREVLGQHQQPGTGRGRLFGETLHLQQVRADIRPAGHLDGGCLRDRRLHD